VDGDFLSVDTPEQLELARIQATAEAQAGP